MECKFIKKLKDKSLITEFQNKYLYVFPYSYVEFIKINNGGRPKYERFMTKKGIERCIKSFLSFNFDDIENIWDVVEIVWNQSLVPFATDNFGNMICFNVKTNQVIFWNHEDCSIDSIAGSFRVFIEKLY